MSIKLFLLSIFTNPGRHHPISYHLHRAKEGKIDLDLGWAVALPHPITVLVHMTFDEVIIHKSGTTEFFTETI